MKKAITKKLEEDLLVSNNIKDYLKNNEEALMNISISDYIIKKINASKFKKSEIIKRSGLNTSYAYEILNGFKTPTRDKLLRFLIALEMDYDDVQTALKICRYPALYIRMKRDSIIVYSITNKKSVVETNILLDDYGFEGI